MRISDWSSDVCSSDLIALDSNILAYLAGVSRSVEDDAKIARVRELVSRLANSASLIAPAQTLGELFVVLRRSGASAEEAREILLEFADAFGSSASEARTALSAADLVVYRSDERRVGKGGVRKGRMRGSP